METFNTFQLALQALEELKPEIRQREIKPVPLQPGLTETMFSLGPLPWEALFLGMAEDGLPVLLNRFDPATGPILIIGDEGSGKTDFLRSLAGSVTIGHLPDEVKFSVLTRFPEEWAALDNSPSSKGIWPLYTNDSLDFLLNLVGWVESNRRNDRSMLLLIDDLQALIDADPDLQSHIRWLFLHGPSKGIWPIVTLKTSRIRHLRTWLDYFRTRIFAHTSFENQSDLIFSIPVDLSSLSPGIQFALQEGRNWLKFWIPTFDRV